MISIFKFYFHTFKKKKKRKHKIVLCCESIIYVFKTKMSLYYFSSISYKNVSWTPTIILSTLYFIFPIFSLFYVISIYGLTFFSFFLSFIMSTSYSSSFNLPISKTVTGQTKYIYKL